MWVMCFYAKKKGFSEPVRGDVKAGGQREKKETSRSLFPCPPFSAACYLLLFDKCLLVPAASFCPLP